MTSSVAKLLVDQGHTVPFSKLIAVLFPLEINNSPSCSTAEQKLWNEREKTNKKVKNIQPSVK